MTSKQKTLICLLLLLLIIVPGSRHALARPRPPLPPMPDFGLLNSWRFDDTNSWGSAGSAPLASQGVSFSESWSGYALRVPLGNGAIARFSAVRNDGRENLRCDSGSVRFWFAPDWTSAGAGGKGPGSFARLIEVGAPSAKAEGWWALYFDPEGSAIHFSGQAGGQSADYLKAPIAWSAGEWHQIVLAYDAKFSALYLDGQLAAEGEGVAVWPDDATLAGGFCLGGDAAGGSLAGGQFDDVVTLDHPCNEWEVGFGYMLVASTSRLGPITAEQEAAWREASEKRRAEREAALAEQQNSPMMMQSSSSCDTNGPARLTNVVCSFSTNDGWTVVFDIHGGADWELYDIFRTTSLMDASVTNSSWTWLEQGPTCFTYTYTNQPAANAFYVLGRQEDSDFDGLTDAFEGLVTHTAPLMADTDGDGVPDGDEDSNQNGIPDRFDYSGHTSAVIYTVDSTAAEGGGGGEFNILLPSPAPTNGTTILLHLGGTAGYESDYLLSTSFGYITNEVVFSAGESLRRIFVTAVDNAVQQTRPRTVQVALLSSVNYTLDPTPANVSLLDNDLPVVAIFADDDKAAESSGTTDNGSFHLRRYGDTVPPLTVYLDLTGSAQNGVDYAGVSTAITFPAGSDRLTIDITPVNDTLPEPAEDVIATLSPSPFLDYTRHLLHLSARIVIKDDDLPSVSITALDNLATEYGGDPGAIGLTRNGSTAQPLTVTFTVSGTASNGVDFTALSNSATFPPTAALIYLNVQPLADALEETAETVTVTLRGGPDYKLSGTNAATVWIDDDSPTRYSITPIQTASVYSTTPAIDSPAVYDVTRFGRSASAASLPFTVYTNTGSGFQVTTTYRVYGAVSGSSITFPALAAKARLNFTSSLGVPHSGDQAIVLHVPSISPNFWPIQILRTWEYVRLEVLSSPAIEGTATHGRLRLSRLGPGDPVSATFTYTGNAMGPGDPLTVDHNLVSPFTLTIPANELSVETNIIALADGYLEGWETLAIRPVLSGTTVSISPITPLIVQMRENVADPNALPGTDTDFDGAPDYWEIANNLDPLDTDDGDRDADGDGLTNVDEYQASLNPRSADSDNDGTDDLRESYQEMTRPDDFVPVRLHVRDKGKVNNGMNCAVCHTTQLKVGDNTLYSRRSSWQEPVEKTFWYEKGRSYPISLMELVITLPAPPNNGANPTTTATYTAGILQGTNTPRAFVVLDPDTKLGTNKPWADFPTNATGPIGTLIVPRIELSWDSLPGNAPPDANTNAGGGVRVYPDQLSPTDTESRRGVYLKVRTTPPVPGQRVLLRSIDVDDPTPQPEDPNFLIDTNDIAGFPIGGDNRGSPKSGTLHDTSLTLDVFGEASTVFDVTLQPGDNFRVAGILDSPGGSNQLNALQVTNLLYPYFVSADQAPVSEFLGGVSPLLTVWRKLHLEFDSMSAPPASGPEALHELVVVFSVSPNYPSPGVSSLGLNKDNGLAGMDLYEGGKLEIPGILECRILKSNSRLFTGGRARIGIETDVIVPTNIVGLAAKLYDDDDRFLVNETLYPSLLNLPAPLPISAAHFGEIVPLLRSAYSPAYIDVVDANSAGWNSTATIPFRRSQAAIGLSPLGLLVSYFDQGNLDLKGRDRPEFWAHSVVYGYEPAHHEDGENNEEDALEGGTPKWRLIDGHPTHQALGFSVVFLECIRDVSIGRIPAGSFNNPSPVNLSELRLRYWARLAGQTAHEVAHAPGRQSGNEDHGEHGLMESGGESHPGVGAPQSQRFSPATIKRIRATPQWSN